MTRALAIALLPLLFGACALDDVDPETSQAESDLSAAQWQPAQDAGFIGWGESPNLTYWNNQLAMAVGPELRTLDGSTWSKATYPFGSVNETPPLAVLGGQLYAAISRSGWIGVCQVPSGGCSYTSPGYNISLAVLGSKLYLAYAQRQSDERDRLVLARVDGTTITTVWSRLLDIHNYVYGTALASWSSQLHLVWGDGLGSGGAHPMHELTIVPGSYSVVDNDIGMNSVGTISMTVCNGSVHLLHQGDSNASQIWWSYRPATSSSTWTTNVRLAESDAPGGAGIGCNVYVMPTLARRSSTYGGDVLWAEFQ